MKFEISKALATAVAIAIVSTTPAAAESLKDEPIAAPVSPHYFRLEAGIAWSDTDTGTWVSPGGERGNWAFDDDTSFYGGLAVGRNLMPGVRGDISFSANFGQDFDGCRIPGGQGNTPACGQASVSTSVDTYLLLANLFIEPLALMGYHSGAIRPFVTVAAGVAWNDMDTWTRVNPTAPQPVRRFQGDTETSFAWAIGGGASIDMSSMFGRQAFLDVTYRYVDAGEAQGGRRADVGNGIPVEPLNFDVQFHAVTAGVRIPF